ncbi:MAG: hypothetical protein MJ200_01320 [Mycoplasmoidaceae bacterium]|nr:hypothetical protein [Mycoplasmoidaceae bacterium]
MKLKFVLPSLGITSCALAIAPFATSCSKSDAFQLKISKGFDNAYVSRLYNFKLNKPYKFIAHINKLPFGTSLS